jgi:phage terminase Nu1 subunit (DNA packaging protein)
VRKLKDELALAQATVKQLKDSEVGHLVKSNAQQNELERVTKENRELLEQVR